MTRKIGETAAARLDELLVKTSRTFALSIPVLPQPTRRGVTVAYLLFRIADTLEDATRWRPEHQFDEMGRLRALLERPAPDQARRLVNDWLADPPLDREAYLELLGELPMVLDALEALPADARDLVRDHTVRTVDRMAAFVRRERPLQLRDVDDLRDYCYAVAGIVGEMLTELFLLDRPSLQPIAPALRASAAEFGEALQLVNILKDSASDLSEGRGYLPPGVGRAEIFALARADLESAGAYARLLQEAGASQGLVAFCALPVRLAWQSLERIEQRGPGAKLTRLEVAGIARSLKSALEDGRPAV